MPNFPTSRPRAAGPTSRQISQWTRYGASLDDEVPNPWLQPLQYVASKDNRMVTAVDEGHWRAMMTHPVIRSAIEKRITLSLSRKPNLRPGRGDQAERVYDVWNRVVERLPFFSFLETGFLSIFWGWRPVELYSDRGFETVEGTEVRMPQDLVAAENQHFAFTLGRDLIVKPPGRLDDWKIWRMSSLGSRLKWCLYQQGIGMPYGESILGCLAVTHYVSTILRDTSVIQLRRGAGIPRVSEMPAKDGLQGSRETLGSTEAAKTVTSTFQEFIDTWDGTGVLRVPRGWEFGFESIEGIFDGWVKVLQWDADTLNAALLGGNLLGQISGASGSRAASEVMLQMAIQQAKADARKVAELVRRRLFWPWTVLNAAAFGYETRSLVPTFDDVPLESLPTLEFPNLRRPDKELLGMFLEKVKVDPEDADDFRLDVVTLASDGDLELLREGQDGPHPDLARRPPPDFEGDQETPEDAGSPDGEDSEVEDETEDARDGRPNRARS